MKKVLETLQTLIKSEVSNQISLCEWPLQTIRKVYFGDPILIPEIDLPAISIAPKQSAYILRWSRYDQKIFNFEVRIIENKKSFYNKTNPTQDRVDIVEAMIDKAETLSWNEVLWTSLCWIIQKNICLSDNDWVRVAENLKVENVNYSFNESRGFPTYEAIISVTCTVVWNR